MMSGFSYAHTIATTYKITGLALRIISKGNRTTFQSNFIQKK